MCFYNDYDWYADVQVDQGIRTTEAGRCYECNRPIESGDWCRSIYQQEHDECQICECDWSDYFDPEIPHDCDYGETFQCLICKDCCKMLESVYRLEAEEGCPERARQPSFGGLSEEVFSYDYDNKYRRRVLADWPELAGHIWLEIDEDEDLRDS